MILYYTCKHLIYIHGKCIVEHIECLSSISILSKGIQLFIFEISHLLH